jgi:hypothetical protein
LCHRRRFGFTPLQGRSLAPRPNYFNTPGTPPVEVLFRETMIAVGRIGFVERSDGLARDLAPPRAVGATEPSVDGLFLGAETPSTRHSGHLSLKRPQRSCRFTAGIRVATFAGSSK